MKTIIMTNKLSKSFFTGANEQLVINSLDLEIYENDFTIIMGPSGAGKSTLLYSLSGMDRPTLGEIYYKSEKISNYNEDQLALFRRKNCGFVFQQVFLLENLSVMENVIVCGLLLNKRKREITSYAEEMFEKVGLGPTERNKFPSQISGGQAQRAAIVRALINRPSVVFADEPTGSLNSASGKAVLDVLTNINEMGQSIIMVTHDIKSALRGNRIIYLQDGMIGGEIALHKYKKDDSERFGLINDFLSEMGW